MKDITRRRVKEASYCLWAILLIGSATACAGTSPETAGDGAKDGTFQDALGETPVGAGGCVCGDGKCESACNESLAACPYDCKACGDGVCSPTEGPLACAIDCCGGCGDGKCRGFGCGESPAVCPADCGSACGNQSCDKGEAPATCAIDCAWQVCGNGVCEPGDGGSDGCSEDCGTACGNCICDKGESFMDCPVDCGFCGDHVCSTCKGLNESPATCPADCGVTFVTTDAVSDDADSATGDAVSHKVDATGGRPTGPDSAAGEDAVDPCIAINKGPGVTAVKAAIKAVQAEHAKVADCSVSGACVEYGSCFGVSTDKSTDTLASLLAEMNQKADALTPAEKECFQLSGAGCQEGFQCSAGKCTAK